MVKIKRQRGITLIALILTIVIALILASITIYVGTDDIEYSKMVKFVAYMQTIQKKVDLIAQYQNYENLGTNLTNEQKSVLNSIFKNNNEIFKTTTDSETLKFFDTNAIASQLDIQNVDDDIVIDFATREVISLTGVEYENRMYYSQYNLPGGQTLITHQDTDEPDLTFDSITANVDGLNATITVAGISITNGTLSYSTNKNTWVVVTNYTIADQPVETENITKSGTYYFKLTNNITGEDNGIEDEEQGTTNYPSVTLKLTNAPKLKGNLEIIDETYNYSNIESQENWAYAKDSTNNNLEYVWIPRFAYETEDNTNIVFLRGTSDITTEGSYITSDWTVPTQFKSGNTELTGVWVKTDTYNTTNIIEILQNGTIL